MHINEVAVSRLPIELHQGSRDQSTHEAPQPSDRGWSHLSRLPGHLEHQQTSRCKHSEELLYVLLCGLRRHVLEGEM